jgi:hypothetical protein
MDNDLTKEDTNKKTPDDRFKEGVSRWLLALAIGVAVGAVSSLLENIILVIQQYKYMGFNSCTAALFFQYSMVFVFVGLVSVRNIAGDHHACCIVVYFCAIPQFFTRPAPFSTGCSLPESIF